MREYFNDSAKLKEIADPESKPLDSIKAALNSPNYLNGALERLAQDLTEQIFNDHFGTHPRI